MAVVERAYDTRVREIIEHRHVMRGLPVLNANLLHSSEGGLGDRFGGAWLLLLTLAWVCVWGCTVPSLDIGGRSCPCTMGWVCNEATNSCEPRERAGAGAEGGCEQEACTGACGVIGDGCGGLYDCGRCPDGQVCGADGPNVCGKGTCTPLTCKDLDLSCGMAADGCGATLACGECTAPETCGGGGMQGRCGQPVCVPRTCELAFAECGQISDGCGGVPDCGACSDGEVCGVAAPNRCAPPPCSPITCEAAGAQCGDLGDGCGGTLACGTCGSGGSCGGSGIDHQCGCSPITACKSEGLEVQVFVDRDLSGTFEAEERVCTELTWSDMFQVLSSRSLSLGYSDVQTPCPEVARFERWGVIATGYFALSTTEPGTAAPPEVTVELTADINDGARLRVLDPVTGTERCLLEMWRDVPHFDNYQSTDALIVNSGCRATLRTEVPYPMTLEFYHQGDPAATNTLFNRAKLSLYHSGYFTKLGINYLHDL